MAHLGIDLGGTKTAMGIVDTSGKITQRTSFATVTGNFDSYCRQLNQEIGEFLNECQLKTDELQSIGVGAAGQIELGTGTITFAPNLGWKNAPLGQRLKQAFPQASVTIDNDVRAATVGEYLFSYEKRPSIYINIFLGTGIGSGIIIHNRILRGYTNSAGEIGQTTICHDGPSSPNGNHGVYEFYGSGTALTRMAREKYAQNADLFPGITKAEQIDGKLVSDLAGKGNQTAKELIAKTGYYIGAGMTNVVNFLNPEVISYGGGLAEIGETLITPMIETIKKRAIPSAFQQTTIKKASLGNDAGIIGAAFLYLVDDEGNIANI